MKYTIEGFSQKEALTFRRIETVKRKNQKTGKYEEKETEVKLDCIDLVILRWFVDFYPKMIKIEINGVQYAWFNYKSIIEDMPLLDIKKGMLYIRLNKMVSFGILKHETVKSSGTFSYYGFGPEYARLIDTSHVQNIEDHMQENSEWVSKKLDTPTQKIREQINPSTKDPSTKSNIYVQDSQKAERDPRIPTLKQVEDYIVEKGYHFNASDFYAYYEASNWHLQTGKKITRWKMCCATWERNCKDKEAKKNELHERFKGYSAKTKKDTVYVNSAEMKDMYCKDGEDEWGLDEFE